MREERPKEKDKRIKTQKTETGGGSSAAAEESSQADDEAKRRCDKCEASKVGKGRRGDGAAKLPEEVHEEVKRSRKC